jgi:hypothetical protein
MACGGGGGGWGGTERIRISGFGKGSEGRISVRVESSQEVEVEGCLPATSHLKGAGAKCKQQDGWAGTRQKEWVKHGRGEGWPLPSVCVCVCVEGGAMTWAMLVLQKQTARGRRVGVRHETALPC